MPVWQDYKELMRSDVADIKNAGSRDAGACTAAIFLKEFVGGKQFTKRSSDQLSEPTVSTASSPEFKNWAHIDIASVMTSKSASGYDVKGMTGNCLKLVSWFL
jgi:aminopeptidase